MNRDQRAAVARETLEILGTGRYRSPSGSEVSIQDELAAAVSGTRLYRPEDFPRDLPLPPAGSAPAKIEVTGETTLEAARRLVAAGHPEPLCLNFASAKNPGGGFQSGSQAQEESLARSSGLYASQQAAWDMYEHNRQLTTCLYSDTMIYSPAVPVFRDDDSHLLDQPYQVAFLSAPAVNAGAVRRNEPGVVDQIEPVMRERLRKLLWVAARHGHGTLVLGAWGCGVFANEPAAVARLFAEQLLPGGPFAERFARVVFAVFDRTPDQQVLAPFQHALASR